MVLLFSLSSLIIFIDIGKNLSPILATPAILITGGYSSVPGTSKSVEMWSPDGRQCLLPPFPDDDRYLHTQENLQVCGGGHYAQGWHTCVTFSDGNWTVTHNFTFSQRWGHTSWYTKGGTFLMAGGKFASESIIIKDDRSVERGFKMKNNTNYACSIPDGEKSVVITGGYNHMTLATATRYNSDGYVENLPSMISGRYSHGCSGYYNDEDKLVYLVVGGFTEHGSGRLDTTETFLEGHHHWRQVNSLPYHVSGLKATTLDNRIIAFGGYDDPKHNNYLNEILEFNPSNTSWVKIGKMLKMRSYHAVSVIDISKVEKYCL